MRQHSSAVVRSGILLSLFGCNAKGRGRVPLLACVGKSCQVHFRGNRWRVAVLSRSERITPPRVTRVTARTVASVAWVNFFLYAVTLDSPRGCMEDNWEMLENRDVAAVCTPGALCIESNVMSLAGRRGFCAVDAAHARPPLWGAGDICSNPPAGAWLILRQVSCKRSCVHGPT